MWLKNSIRNLWRKRQADALLDEEVRGYVEMLADEKVTRGLTQNEARREAKMELGGVEQVKEQTREVRAGHFLETLWQDIRYGARMLRKSPGFTAVAVLTLALGIGANTAIFSAVNPILFEPLPYPHPERIMMIWGIFQGARSQVTFFNYRELLQRNHSFEALAIFEPWEPTMVGGAEPERFEGQNVSYGYFRALGTEPAIGRDFQPADDTYQGAPVAILSYGLWQRRFGADRSIVGRQITLDGTGYTVIGIMPGAFENVLSPTAEIWSPESQYNPSSIQDTNTGEWGNHLSIVARLRPGVTFAQARADIGTIARIPVPDFPRPRWASLRLGFIVDSLQADITREVKPALLAVLGAVMLVLLIACVNVTNLLLARGAQRLGEFAMRAALGAGRSRLTQQLLTESLMLALIGGALGMLIAQGFVQAIIALSPGNLPRLSAIGLDQNAFLFTLGATTIIGLLVGLIPAVHASRGDLQSGLKEGSRQIGGSHQFTRRALVVAEVALALVLLVSAGLLLRSLTRLFAVSPGFNPSNVLTMQVQTSARLSDSPTGNREQFFKQALENVQHVPGVQSAAFTSLLPLADNPLQGLYGAFLEKENGAPIGNGYGVFRYVVTPDYFKTMGIPLRRGRLLEQTDAATASYVTVISESLVREKFGNQNPLGQRMKIGGHPNWPWYSIVGVVGDVRQDSLAGAHFDAAYITPEQSWYADQAMSLVVSARGSSATLIPEIKNAIWSVDKNQPIVRVTTMSVLLAATVAQRRFTLILFEAFGIVALALSAIGIYGVLSGSVAERTREIGIRLALGAPRANILWLIARQGMTLTAFGVAIGLGGAFAASRAIASQLFGVSPLDAITYAGVIVLLAAVATIACWVPAWRAARVDPCVTLRAE
ncbi:MAG TPA: ABC transporter permease [Candidatus Acidoferrales bacterium]|nr:ABC transporter permease [Candidatus Acidoferrales bacterium]